MSFIAHLEQKVRSIVDGNDIKNILASFMQNIILCHLYYSVSWVPKAAVLSTAVSQPPAYIHFAHAGSQTLTEYANDDILTRGHDAPFDEHRKK